MEQDDDFYCRVSESGPSKDITLNICFLTHSSQIPEPPATVLVIWVWNEINLHIIFLSYELILAYM